MMDATTDLNREIQSQPLHSVLDLGGQVFENLRGIVVTKNQYGLRLRNAEFRFCALPDHGRRNSLVALAENVNTYDPISDLSIDYPAGPVKMTLENCRIVGPLSGWDNNVEAYQRIAHARGERGNGIGAISRQPGNIHGIELINCSISNVADSAFLPRWARVARFSNLHVENCLAHSVGVVGVGPGPYQLRGMGLHCHNVGTIFDLSGNSTEYHSGSPWIATLGAIEATNVLHRTKRACGNWKTRIVGFNATNPADLAFREAYAAISLVGGGHSFALSGFRISGFHYQGLHQLNIGETPDCEVAISNGVISDSMISIVNQQPGWRFSNVECRRGFALQPAPGYPPIIGNCSFVEPNADPKYWSHKMQIKKNLGWQGWLPAPVAEQMEGI